MSTPIEHTFQRDLSTPNGSQEIHPLHTSGPHSIHILLPLVDSTQNQMLEEEDCHHELST